MTVVLFGFGLASAWSQQAPETESLIPTEETAEAPVVVGDHTLFPVRSRLFSFSPEERARAISERLDRVYRDNSIAVDNIRVYEREGAVEIVAGELVIMTVTEQDAQAAGMSRPELAQEYAQIIRETVAILRAEFNWRTLALSLLWAGLATIIFFGVIFSLGKLLPVFVRKLHSWQGTRIRTIRIQKLELLTAHRITSFLVGVLKLVHVFALLALTYSYVSVVLNFFPWTRGYSRVLFEYVLRPVQIVATAIASYLPNLFFVLVILIVTYYAMKAVRFFFQEVERGTLEISGFYPEWAMPTYKISRLLIIAFAAVVMFPYLPGSQSPAFRGVSIFLGLLLSLGSTSAVANMVAGTVLTYTRAFQVGDRVKIGEAQGDVMERTLLVTRIRTIKNEAISIPNAIVLNSHVTNFSSSAKENGLVLHTGVTIGYDAPWRQVHQLLLEAAASTKAILKEPEPFVLQTSLDDFYVSYEINAFTDDPNRMAQTYSELHQNIQDRFFEAGVEIMSPHYGALRDGNSSAIPQEYLPPKYNAPTWRVFPKDAASLDRSPGQNS
jgi:small-conductance mechanosensitive channel